MTRKTALNWTIKNLPFYYKPLPKPKNGNGIPDSLPFSLCVDKSTGTLMQYERPQFKAILDKVYSHGSVISGLMDKGGIGQEYAENFIRFINSSMPPNGLLGKRVLEIGCGTGYLLHRLKQAGANVLGIEPGLHGHAGSKKYNIKIIQGFFPTSAITEKFDIIIIYTVLEHMANPSDFLKSIRNYLNPNGTLFIAVPDVELFLKTGDVSFLFHEHFSYYTNETLKNSLAVSGYKRAVIQTSNFGQLLYATAQLGTASRVEKKLKTNSSAKLVRNFKNLAKLKNKKISTFIREAVKKKESIGIYVPGRAINVLAMTHCPTSHIRFFDDNKALHHTYFPGFSIPVESRQEFVKQPPKRLLIMSHAFGDKIARGISEISPKKVSILTWSDVFLKKRQI